MSGPVTSADLGEEPKGPNTRTLELTDSKQATVGAFPVRRALPLRKRRTVGAWCFVDHMGPAAVSADRGLGVGPHPHIGLQTVTWLIEGEVLHRDSLGSEQVIRPGQLNLMTAGHGVSHSEEGTGRGATVHGVQLWVAQPEGTREGPAAFEHHGELPKLEMGNHATATVLVGNLGGVRSSARRDTDHLGADLDLRPGEALLPLEPGSEHALIVLSGEVSVEGKQVTPGHLAYLGTGRDELGLATAGEARALLIGGAPFDETVLMWWNYVARTRDEITGAHDDWSRRASRFGTVDSALAPMDAPPLLW